MNTEKGFETLQERLESVLRLARQQREKWQGISAEIGENSQNTDEDLFKEVSEAIAEMEMEINKPLARIAVVGTTSSAKSSLLNFLCGAELLPTGVQEKSAGITRIVHSAQPSLLVEETAGAVWQCSERQVESADEIREILEQIMDQYRELADEDNPLEAPSFIIGWPTMASDLLGLPDSFRLELLDLPGLRYTGDDRNRQIIGECRNSLCLVAIGAHETDPVKQEQLLEDVIDIVSAIGAPLERILFVATRVDEFMLRHLREWPENEEAFMNERAEAIGEILLERFGYAGPVQLCRISPQPALACLQLRSPALRDEAWKIIRSSYQGLVEHGRGRDREGGICIETDLSSSSSRQWEEEDWNKIILQLADTTAANEFLGSVSDRLLGSLSSIILPSLCEQLLQAFEDARQRIVSNAVLKRAKISGDLNSHYQLLDRAIQKQTEINDKCTQDMRRFLTAWLDNEFNGKGSRDELAVTYPGFNPQLLPSLRNWRSRLKQYHIRPIQAVANRLIEKKKIPENLSNGTALEKQCSILSRHRYRKEQAEKGYIYEVHDNTSGKNLQDSFNRMYSLCLRSARSEVESGILKQMEEITTAIESLQKILLEIMRERSSELPSEVCEVGVITPQGLKRFVEANLKNTVENCKDHTSTSRSVLQVQRRVRNQSDTGWYVWDTMVDTWRKLMGTDWREERVQIVRQQIKLPPLKDIAAAMEKEFDTLASEIAAKFQEHITTQMIEFEKSMAQCQNQLFENYRQNLSAAMNFKSADVQHDMELLDASLRTLDIEWDKLKDLRNSYAIKKDRS